MRKLEIGGGSIKCPGYEQLDIIPGDGIDIVGDASNLYMIEDNTYDEIYCKNVIEHFPFSKTVEILVEWKRILKSGGKLICSTPMLLGMIKDFLCGKNTFWEMQYRIYGGQTTDYDFHHAGFDTNTIKECFTKAGFKDIKILSENDYSTVIEGVKP